MPKSSNPPSVVTIPQILATVRNYRVVTANPPATADELYAYAIKKNQAATEVAELAVRFMEQFTGPMVKRKPGRPPKNSRVLDIR